MLEWRLILKKSVSSTSDHPESLLFSVPSSQQQSSLTLLGSLCALMPTSSVLTAFSPELSLTVLSLCFLLLPSLSIQQCFLPQSPLMFKDQMQQDVIMVLKFPSNSPVTHVAANTLPHLTIPAVVTVTCSRLFAVNRWHNTVGTCAWASHLRKGP